MRERPDPVAALAAALHPGRAEALLSRRVDGAGGAPPVPSRPERLAVLDAALRPPAPSPGGGPAGATGRRTQVRPTHGEAPVHPALDGEPSQAWPVLAGEDVLPFTLPFAAPGLLHVDAHVLALGARAARAAENGLASVLGGEVAIRARLLAGLPEAGGVALVPIELTALADRASLAVERPFAARVAERVAGGTGHPRPTTALAPAERAVLELAVLGALDALSGESGIESALAPRLGTRGGPSSPSACIELAVSAAGTAGRAYLVLPAAALQALPRSVEPPDGLAGLPVPASLLSGRATLPRTEAEALAPGDVLVLDGGGDEAAELRLPGGASLSGVLTEGDLSVRRIGAGVPPDPGSMRVAVEVELAEVAIPLRELTRIAPGAVLPLGIDRSGRVRLRLGGAAIATGELVEVDGTVGVRILARREGA